MGITVCWRGGAPISKVQGNARDANEEAEHEIGMLKVGDEGKGVEVDS